MIEYNEILERYLDRYPNYYSTKVIEYSKIVVNKIKATESLINFFSINKIDIEKFLNEMLPLSEYKFQTVHDEILNMNEMNYIFNLILIGDELEKLYRYKHVRIIAIKDTGRLTYQLDDVAIKKLKHKFDIDLETNIFSLDDLAIDDDENDSSDSGKICLN